ncbi:MAG: aspartate kinase, partial [Bacteroidetes bacterium]
MAKEIKVFKFGGASVRDAEAIKHVGSILQSYQAERLVIIVSAMGGVTNALEEVVRAHQARQPEAYELLAQIQRRHYDTARELLGEQHPVYDELNDHFATVEWTLDEEPDENYDFVYDQIVSLGELASSSIVAAYLNS